MSAAIIQAAMVEEMMGVAQLNAVVGLTKAANVKYVRKENIKSSKC